MEDYYDIDAILAEDQVDKRAATPLRFNSNWISSGLRANPNICLRPQNRTSNAFSRKTCLGLLGLKEDMTPW